jgi:non-heme chloroperoxidase
MAEVILYMSANTHFIQLKNGITLPYAEQGDPSGTPVIFLHGVTDSHRSFDLLMEHMPERFRAIAVTQRGHGDASKPDSGFGPEELAEDLRLFMDSLKIDSAVIVGHSMGSFAAQRFAAENPERLKGLVLIGSFSTCSNNEGVKEFVENVIKPLTDPVPVEVAAMFQSETYAKELPRWFEDMVVSESLKAPARVWKEACITMIDTDHSSLLRRIKQNTLLLWGDHDSFFPADEQERLLMLVPAARLEIYQGVGHAPHWEDPERAGANIVSYIEEIALTRSIPSALS